MGRIEPTTRSIVTNDSPTAAEIRTLVAEPFVLIDGDQLLISIDGAPTVDVLFEDADFADISIASASEIAAVLTAQLGISSVDEDGYVVLTSNTTGLTSTIEIKGGRAQTALQFATGESVGTQGTYTYLFGHERSGVSWNFSAGDSISISQGGEYNDAQIVRLHGQVTFRDTPSGYTWSVGGFTGGWQQVMVDEAQYSAGFPRTRDVSDLVLNVSGLVGVQTLILGLELMDSGGGAGEVFTELPAFWLDWVEFDENPDDLFLANRTPGPEEVGIPATVRQVSGTIVNTSGSAIDAASIEILVDGQIAYQSGAFVAPFNGALSAITAATGPSAADYDFVVDLTGYDLTGRASESPIIVLVNATTPAPAVLGSQWTFYLADTISPQITSVVPTSLTELLVTFSEPVTMTDDLDGALRAPSYLISRRSAPSVPVNVISVAENTSSSVVLTLDMEASMGATYRLVADSLTDIQGNVVDDNYIDFIAYRPTPPPGRFFSLWDKLPQQNRRADISRDLRKFILCLQDQADLLLHLVDEWPQVWQIDKAPETFLDVILAELGNPFDFVLTVAEKRKLVGLLTTIYRQKGTAAGIINAVRFFIGIDVTITPLNVRENFWLVGFNDLGIDTFLAPPKGDPAWYSFWIDSPVILTDAERATVLALADYMKPAHEHILGIREPGGIISAQDYWVLGQGLLGVTTIAGV